MYSLIDLKSHQFISYFEPEEAAQLCQMATLETFTDQNVIFEEGEIPDCLYLILAGKVELRKRTGTNKYQTIASAWQNDFFGEFGILDGEPRSAQAVACSEVILAKIPRDGLLEILHNTKGSVVIHLFRYITKRLRTTTEQYVNQVSYKEKMVLLGEMVNTIIHDFKSPFNGMQLASEMVKELHPDEETQEWCDLIQAQGKRMFGMAEEVLEFARGSVVLSKKPVKLAQLLQQFEKLNRVYFKFGQVEFVVRAVDVKVNVDENKLLRVLQNFVGNAVEAFEGRGGRVEISTSVAEKWVVINISDNGPGIPEAIRDRFFEPFVTYGKRGGTGLGTAIAKSIVDAHDGEIGFKSTYGEGTIIHIRLPLSAS